MINQVNVFQFLLKSGNVALISYIYEVIMLLYVLEIGIMLNHQFCLSCEDRACLIQYVSNGDCCYGNPVL